MTDPKPFGRRASDRKLLPRICHAIAGGLRGIVHAVRADVWMFVASLVLLAALYVGQQANSRSVQASRDAKATAEKLVTESNLSAGRDSARLYQGCEGRRGLTAVLNIGLAISPKLRALVESREPEVLGRDGQIPSPDCEKTYPGGRANAERFPSAAPVEKEQP